MLSAGVIAAMVCWVSPLQAAEPTYRIFPAVDVSIIALGVVGTGLLHLVPVDQGNFWPSELFPFDEPVKNNFSPRSAAISDGLLATTVLTSMLVNLGTGIDQRTGRAALIYAQVLTTNTLVQTFVKVMVQRPRPYTYHHDPSVRARRKDDGNNAHYSFYSGHSSIAFASAVSGALLFAVQSDDGTARAVVWAAQLAMASATANLRVRAGKHYYSDVLFGAVMGTLVGVLVPLAHLADRGRYTPDGGEFVAMAAGLSVGILASHLMPLDEIPLPPGVGVMPMAMRNGGGVAVRLAL